MNSIRLLTSIVIFILIFTTGHTSGQETLIFASTSFEIELEGDLINSKNVRVTLTNGPALSEDFSYRISFENGLTEDFGSVGGTIETSFNLLSNGRIINLELIGPSTEINLANREVTPGIWNHVSHIFANWTFGSNPPPDGRGFGQGAVIDSQILDSLTNQNITSQDELIILAEDIFNVLFGSSVDFNSDNAVKTFSDNWGLYNYSIGMRDHIRNAGNADTVPTSSIATSTGNIVINFANIVEEGDPGLVYSKLNNSETTFGNIFQSIIYINQNLTESNFIQATDSLKNNVTELTGFILQNYEEFRSVVFNFKVDIVDFEVTITESSITSKSSDSPILSEIVFLSMIFIAIITSKLHMRKKKV